MIRPTAETAPPRRAAAAGVGVRLRLRIQSPADTKSSPVLERVVEVDAATGAVTLGRRVGADVQLPFWTVSATHARLVRQTASWAVVDLGSANGTFFQDRRLAPGNPKALREGDVFRLADVTVIFEGLVTTEAKASVGVESTATLARRLVSDLFGAQRSAETARLVIDGGPSAGQALSLSPGQLYRIGRAAHCDLTLVDDDVSREHASVVRLWDGIEIRDLGSKNGIDVDGALIAGVQRLSDGAVVTIGNTRLRVEDPEERYLRQMQEEAAGGGPAKTLTPETTPRGSRGGRRTVPVAPVRGLGVIVGVALAVLLGVAAVVVWLVVGGWS